MAGIRSGAGCDVVFRRCDVSPKCTLVSIGAGVVPNARNVGESIGIVEVVLSFPTITTIWPGTYLDAVSALQAPVPLLGLTGWLVGHLVGWVVRDPDGATASQGIAPRI